MDIAALLSRLSRVKATGPGKWIACCPAHQDRTPSLTIKLGDDGRILIHDFGGCSAVDVMDSLGLQVSDLFDRPLFHRAKPVHTFTAADALRALRREAAVVALSIADHADGKPVDLQRLQLAAERIADAAEYVHVHA